MGYMGEWRGKDDLDLTSRDLADMLEAGQTVDIVGPRLPGDATLVTAVPTYGSGASVVQPAVFAGFGMHVSQPLEV